MLHNNEMLIANNSSDNVLVDARLLHKSLQIQTPFSIWIKRRIDDFQFEEGKDFSPIVRKTNRLTKLLGGQNAVEYHLTLGMAKELAMLERSDIGRSIRRYFIAVEAEARRLYESGASHVPQLPAELARKSLNGRTLLPYREFLQDIGASVGGSAYRRQKAYPNHFVKIDELMYVSAELARHIMLTTSAYRSRRELKDMQPLLPLDFGCGLLQEGGAL